MIRLIDNGRLIYMSILTVDTPYWKIFFTSSKHIHMKNSKSILEELREVDVTKSKKMVAKISS